MMLQRLDALFVPIIFDQGVSPGEGSDMNRLTVAIDGQGRPVLRGTSIAGVLRSEYAAVSKKDIVNLWFGDANNSVEKPNQCQDSLIQFDTAVLDVGQSGVVESTHHQRNRHTGVVSEGGLFSMESCPPGTKATLAIWVRVLPRLTSEVNELTEFLCGRFECGLVFGGRSARGVGIARLDGAIRRKSYELGTPEGWANQLSDGRRWRETSQIPSDAAKVPRIRIDTNSSPEIELNNRLEINVKLRIPRGQDLLIADGNDAAPQVVKHADGRLYWKLPGSSLRGAFKSWMTRLAARDGKPVQDSHECYENLSREEKAAHPRADQMTENDCPINQLFGTIDNKHRIHFSDAYAVAKGSVGKVSKRTHVAIDRVTGESADGLLFENEVLTADEKGRSPIFESRIAIQNPNDAEVTWLAKSLVALHLGVLRIGSSKACGRLEIMPATIASGALSELFHQTLEDLLGIRRSASSSTTESPPRTKGTLSKHRKGYLEVSCEGNGKKHRVPLKLLQFDLEPSQLPLPVSIELTKNKPKAIYPRLESEEEIASKLSVVADDSRLLAVQPIWSAEVVDKPVSLSQTQRKPPSDGRFHNPYTFVPFQSGLYRRQQVTSLTGDEAGEDKTRVRHECAQLLTGYLDLEVELLRPLLTCQPDNKLLKNHAEMAPLTIGNDVVLPATGIRGSLRTLMTILTSGTLGYINRHGFLCHKRDLPLSTNGEEGRSRGVLAEVVSPGGPNKSGKVRIGDTKLVHINSLHSLFGGQASLDNYRPQGDQPIAHQWIELDNGGVPISYSGSYSRQHCWKLKLSGPLVGWKEGKNKFEGLLKANDEEVTIESSLWQDYAERNKRGSKCKLVSGDLVWLEVKEGTEDPISSDSVLSIQWARWGKKGQRVDELASKYQPDFLQLDGLVDEVTNLFGQVVVRDTADAEGGNALTFAGKIRPENLVFEDLAAATRGNQVTLPVLAQPNGGCIPFYRKANGSDDFRRESPLRGYKVYRVEYDPEFDEEHSAEKDWTNPKPWEYSAQPLYSRNDRPDPEKNKMNKTVCLVPPKSRGKLRIAFRSLSQRELALLIQACHVRWRLGGGKSVSLGLCQPKISGLFTETGRPLNVDWVDRDGKACQWRDLVLDIQDRVRIWSATQTPVPVVRQPRAVNSRGAKNGLVWFTKFCQMKMGDPPVGMQRNKDVCLPEFDVENPVNDWLTGYDKDD